MMFTKLETLRESQIKEFELLSSNFFSQIAAIWRCLNLKFLNDKKTRRVSRLLMKYVSWLLYEVRMNFVWSWSYEMGLMRLVVSKGYTILDRSFLEERSRSESIGIEASFLVSKFAKNLYSMIQWCSALTRRRDRWRLPSGLGFLTCLVSKVWFSTLAFNLAPWLWLT